MTDDDQLILPQERASVLDALQIQELENRRTELEDAGLIEPRAIWCIDVWYDGDTDVYVGWKLAACQRAVVAWANQIWDELYREALQQDPLPDFPEHYPAHMSVGQIVNLLEDHERITMQTELKQICR